MGTITAVRYRELVRDSRRFRFVARWWAQSAGMSTREAVAEIDRYLEAAHPVGGTERRKKASPADGVRPPAGDEPPRE